MTSVLPFAELTSAVGAAVLAPSVLNTQPWRFHAHDDVIDLVAVPERGLRHLDPQGRELLMSCGAALLNLRLALAVQRHATRVRHLPDPDRPTLVARVHVGGPHDPSTPELRLHAAIPVRRTSREPYDRSDVSASVVDDLVLAARAEGARLEAPPEWHRAALAGLVRDADRRQRDDRLVTADVRAWAGEGAPVGAGIPSDRLGPQAADPTSLVRDYSMGALVEGRTSAEFGEEACLLVLLTDHDSPIDRVRAGEALQRVLLEATASGVSCGLLTQPVEVPELRPWLRDPGSSWGSPQALLRLGYGPRPPKTPRRPVHEVLEVT